MKIRICKRDIIYIAFFLIALQDSKTLVNFGVARYIGYTGLFFLLVGCLYSAFINRSVNTKRIAVYALVTILTNMGLIFQKLDNGTKVSLILSMVILITVALFPNGLIKRKSDFKKIAIAILLANVASFALALVFDVPITSIASEAILFSKGFNAGTQNKNYFAYTMISVYVLLDCYGIKNTKKSLSMKTVVLVLLVLANSKSAFAVWGIYFSLINIRKFKITRKNRKILISIVAIIVFLLGSSVYRLLVSNNYNLYFRVNGLNNYLNYISGDFYHLIYGYAEMAFAKQYSYSINVRSAIGWDGSVELVLLNVLIKNGLIGLIGYVVLFVYLFRQIRNISKGKNIAYGIFISFLVSSLAESFLVQTAFTYGLVMYTLIATIPFLYENTEV